MKHKITSVFLILSLIIFGTGIVFAKNNYSYTYTPGYRYSASQTDYNDAKEKILFIIDFSNSMNEPLTVNKTKLEIALDTMYSILPRISPNTWVGLRVYGHTAGFNPFSSCKSSQLITPIAKNNTSNIASSLARVRAVGWTPITYSLKQAINNDFAGFNGMKHIILLSDGGENCDESPCKYIVDLMKYRDDIKIDVIAFAISDDDANNQLKCVSLVTTGKFYTANTASDLADSLENSLDIEKNVSGQVIMKKQE